MTKPRLLALVLVLVAVAVGALCGEDLWYAVCYARKPILARDQLDPGWGMHYLEARASWIPGPQFIMPPQLCHICAPPGYHERCSTCQKARAVFISTYQPVFSSFRRQVVNTSDRYPSPDQLIPLPPCTCSRCP